MLAALSWHARPSRCRCQRRAQATPDALLGRCRPATWNARLIQLLDRHGTSGLRSIPIAVTTTFAATPATNTDFQDMGVPAPACAAHLLWASCSCWRCWLFVVGIGRQGCRERRSSLQAYKDLRRPGLLDLLGQRTPSIVLNEMYLCPCPNRCGWIGIRLHIHHSPLSRAAPPFCRLAPDDSHRPDRHPRRRQCHRLCRCRHRQCRCCLRRLVLHLRRRRHRRRTRRRPRHRLCQWWIASTVGTATLCPAAVHWARSA